MATIYQDRYPSPLRYPGGKGKVTNFLKLLMLENELLDVEYIEPYAGGAGVALSLLFEDFASEIHINDINPGVCAFWRTVLSDTERLCRKIVDTAVTIDEWRRQRLVQLSASPDEFDLAFSTFFLNRTNRSGVIANGGVIGGTRQTGPWKIDARYNKLELCRRIQKIARFRSRITVTEGDAGLLLDLLTPNSGKDLLIYLDPPYYVKGEGLYDDFYSAEDHGQIANKVMALRCPWVVSYDAVPEVLALYASVDRIRYSLRYSAREYYLGSEVMFFAPCLRRPFATSAAGVSSKEVDNARRRMALRA